MYSAPFLISSIQFSIWPTFPLAFVDDVDVEVELCVLMVCFGLARAWSWKSEFNCDNFERFDEEVEANREGRMDNNYNT